MIDAPLGQVFTPPRLAHRLWSQAVAVLDAVSSGAGRTPLRVIEPAAGDGALVRVGREALRARDVNGVAIELDRACIPALRAAAGPWTVLHADALTLVAPDAPVSDMGARAGAMSPAEVAARVPWVPAAGSADLIVANPPWVRETGHSALFRALRRWHSGHYAAACPRNADLSHVFIARIVDWLRPGGVAAVLMPAYWMDTDVGAHVRRRLASQGRIVSAWRAHDVRWFDGVSVEASFFVWQKGAAPQQTAVLAADAAEVAHRISLPEPSCAWTLRVPVEIPSAATEPLGDHWRVIEGVSTAANRLRARDVERVCRGRVGEGIFVLHDDEVEAAGLAGHRLLKRRFPCNRNEWILLVRDGDVTRLETVGEGSVTPENALERHLLRFRGVLQRRAEMRRNPARSWYAVAWPRPEIDVHGCVVTPKWSREPAFSTLPPSVVPMTDQRVLVPKSVEAAAAADALVEWLNGDALAAWWQARARRRGGLMEFYGSMLASVPVPVRLLKAPTACSTR